MTDHSPTPWELVEATEHHGPYICNVYGGDVCDLYAMSNPLMPSTASGGISRPVSFVDAAANAAFIVKAVNSHDMLVKALETAAARFNLMAGVGLVNGSDPKVGYRECMDTLASVSSPPGGGK